MRQRKAFCTLIALMMACASASAQSSLQGRVYHHPNIMSGIMGKEFNKELSSLRKEAIEKKEKEKGRKLTQAETAEVDKALEEGRKQAKAMEKCLTVSMTVEFTSPTDIVVKQKTKVDDDALKKMGMGWLKRKALKATMALAPESQKGKYEVKGSQVFFIDGKDRDTLTLSPDGKTLSGKYDKNTKFTLNRTK